ncbi:glycosyltransferase [Eubacterium sp.]|uniref:glycosyltransferase family 2 protein n=1 Tax=Eubacterium sp. TaxID=142586 RepID=UPI0025831EE1|nr:glycosyltransferase [Eubacterium sp.]MCR5369032.1 glycosyltransferase [Eubacterium sp.]
MKLVIQIPCYNEEENLIDALNALPKSVPGIDKVEYLIINDGSKDRTVEVAREWGVDHIVSFRRNRGLAFGFMAGLDAALRAGADIIVNTDADNQYCADDIATIVAPIVEGKADYVIGERPIDETEHFSKMKKRLQHIGSWTVRVASGTDVPDAPSGFRAISREAALHMNVINNYTYTLETIIQAGHNRTAISNVKVRTNPETRPSRLFKSIPAYVKRSSATIIRAFMMYKPLKFFFVMGAVFLTGALALGIRYIVYMCIGDGAGHIQSLILTAILGLMGFMAVLIGLLGDVIAANRKIIEDIQYHVRKIDYRVNSLENEENNFIKKERERKMSEEKIERRQEDRRKGERRQQERRQLERGQEDRRKHDRRQQDRRG